MACVASGTTGARHLGPTAQLALARPVLIALDADKGGDEASTWWLEVLGPVAQRWRPYWDDPASMLQAGVDIRGWVEAGL